MTRITFERTLPVPIEQAWRLLTDPTLMNLWSVAPVEGRDAQRPGGTRTVHVTRFGIPLTLQEDIVEARPPTCLRYRVRPNWVVRRHSATQTLTPAGPAETGLVWTVEIRSWAPGLMQVLVWSMRGQLERSLDALAELAARE